MTSKLLIAILAVAAFSLIGFMAFQGKDSAEVGEKAVEGNGIEVVLYKSPSCGCCGQYTEYLKDEGYGVEVKLTDDMGAIKKELGVPYELESCHSMEVGGYVIEGHVPEAAIEKLLVEKPDIKGIGLSGMPSGSPGMPGPKNGDFVIYEITHDGEKGSVFMTI